MSLHRQYQDDGRWRVTRSPDDPPEVRAVLDRLEEDVDAGRRLPPRPPVLAKLVDAALRDGDRPTRKMMARLQILAQQCGLDRDDRMELAEVLLRRDVSSWSSFTLAEARTMAAAMEGFALIAHLQARHGRKWRRERELRRAGSTPPSR